MSFSINPPEILAIISVVIFVILFVTLVIILTSKKKPEKKIVHNIAKRRLEKQKDG